MLRVKRALKGAKERSARAEFFCKIRKAAQLQCIQPWFDWLTNHSSAVLRGTGFFSFLQSSNEPWIFLCDLRRRGGAGVSPFRRNGAGGRNPGRAVTRGMGGRISRRVKW